MKDFKIINKKYIFESNSVSDKILNFNNKIIIKIVSNKIDFQEFYKIPWIIYNNDKNWVPPLWNEINNFFKNNNPFWRHTNIKLFLAEKNGKKVGRIAGFIDKKYNKSKKYRVGFFGFFECINDYEISSILFKVVEDWMKSYKISKIMGPIDGRVDIGCGFVYKGFDKSPFFPDNYSKSYYLDLVKNNNMKKSKDFIGYYIDLKKPIPDELRKAADKCEKDLNIKIRSFNKIQAKKEIEWWSNFIIKTFTNHFGYIPVKIEEILERYGIKNIRWFVDKKLFLIAEKNSKPIGFSWTFPNYNIIFKKLNGKFNIFDYIKFYIEEKKINQANMNIIGIEKMYQKKGIASLLNFKTIKELKKREYKDAEIGIVDENNIASRKIIEKTGAIPNKIFRIYEKNINI